MLQSELAINAEIKSETDETLVSLRARQEALIKERETFMEAVSSIDDELKVLRLELRKKEKKYGTYKKVTDEIFELVKQNEGVYSQSNIKDIFMNKGQFIEAPITRMLDTKYLTSDDKGLLRTGGKPKKVGYGSNTSVVLKFMDNTWRSAKDLTALTGLKPIVINGILINLERANKIEVNRDLHRKRCRLAQRNI